LLEGTVPNGLPKLLRRRISIGSGLEVATKLTI